MLDKIYRFTQETGMFRGCTGIIAGVSGGPDSMAMLDILTKNKTLFPFSLVCATVNHNLRPEAAKEAEMVRSYCEKNQIPFELLFADIPHDRPAGVSTEEYARQVRYDFFNQLKKKYGFSHSATAHTADDTCESRILNLIRGCGLDGLEGIAPLRNDTRTARPLLCCKKEELIDYCKKQKLSYCTDASNAENIYRRNIIRNQILPAIQELNPEFPEALQRLAETAETANDFIRQQAEILEKKAAEQENPSAFSLSILQQAHPAPLSCFLREKAKQTGGKTITFSMTEHLTALVKNGRPASRTDFFGGYAEISFGRLVFHTNNEKMKTFLPFTPQEGDNPIGETETVLRLTICFYDGKNRNCIPYLPFSRLLIRPRQEKDYVQPENRPAGGRLFKKLLCDRKITVSKRDQIPLIVSEKESILWTALSGRERTAIPQKGEKAIQIELIHTERRSSE